MLDMKKHLITLPYIQLHQHFMGSTSVDVNNVVKCNEIERTRVFWYIFCVGDYKWTMLETSFPEIRSESAWLSDMVQCLSPGITPG